MCTTDLRIFLWTDSDKISTLQETPSYGIVGVSLWLPGLGVLCRGNVHLKCFRCCQVAALKNAGTKSHPPPRHRMRLPLSPHSQSMINLKTISCCAFPGLHNPGHLAHLFLLTRRPAGYAVFPWSLPPSPPLCRPQSSRQASVPPQQSPGGLLSHSPASRSAWRPPPGRRDLSKGTSNASSKSPVSLI